MARGIHSEMATALRRSTRRRTGAAGGSVGLSAGASVGLSAAAANEDVFVTVTSSTVSALPPSFREGRTREELRALHRQLGALYDQVGEAANATDGEEAAEAARVQAEADAAWGWRLRKAAL